MKRAERKAQRSTEAQTRQAAYDALTPKQKAAKDDETKARLIAQQQG